MEINKLLDKSLKESFLANYELLKETFSQELLVKEGEEELISELLIEFIAECEDAKEFEKITEFTTLLRAKNLKCFKEVYPFYNEFLIRYYCYHGARNELKISVDDFIEAPLADYDLLLKSFWRLIYYGHTDFANSIIENIYHEVKKSPDLVEGVELELFMLKHDIELEKLYEGFLENGSCDWEKFVEELRMLNADFEVDNEFVELINEGFSKDNKKLSERISNELIKDKENAIGILEKAFMRYMKASQIPFSTSGRIWYFLSLYWLAENENRGEYFKLEKKTFKEFVIRQSGFILDYRFEAVLILWGSSYVYDFLAELNLIDEQEYERVKKLLKVFKKLLIDENLSDLWEYNFVHNWSKSNMETAEEWEVENAIFKEYYTKKVALEKKEKEGFFITPNSFLGNEWLDRMVRQSEIQEKEGWLQKVSLPKIGRNQKITVLYQDGTIKKDIKFKKVKKDLESGSCELIDG